MTQTRSDWSTLIDELRAHAALPGMAKAAVLAATQAVRQGQTQFPALGASNLDEPAGGPPVSEWLTSAGNAWHVLQAGATSDAEIELVQALLALGMREHFPSSPEAELEHAATLVWLAAHTRINAFRPVEVAVEAGARALWQAVASVVRNPSLAGAGYGRVEALVAALALADASSEVARAVAAELESELNDTTLRSVLGGRGATSAEAEAPSASTTTESTLQGELSPAPKGPLVTALLAVTLVLAATQAARLLGRYVFAYKRPATLSLTERGLELSGHTELLGKVLKQHKTLVPLTNLASVTREVRFARAGMYAGLITLMLGSYLGVGRFIEAVRVPGGSATLLGLAVLFIVVGLGVDFLLSSLNHSVKGRCRVLVLQRKGKPICVGLLNASEADALLGRIRERVQSPATG